ncbi:MAG: HPr family phosphocarrier protein [Anaerolineae bacterium]
MPKSEIVVRHEVGLHARPAASFVKLAASFPCDITVQNVTTGSKSVNAKSILSVLSIGVSKDNTILIETSGEQADEALAALLNLIEGNFGE